MSQVTTASAVTPAAVLRLAVPAFLTLVAEPLFLLADSAIVGHLGTDALAALGVASVVLLTAAGVFIFLAYATTAVVARALGAGSPARALAAGVDGLWLSLVLGMPTAGLVALFAHLLVRLLGADGIVADLAATYLRIGAAGIPSLLVISAATGVLRGFRDTRTPLLVATVGFAVNGALNYLLVYPAGLGIAGSALGTLIAQTGVAVAFAALVIRRARHEGARLSFHPASVLAAARNGAPLLVRTIALRAAFLATTWVAAGFGAVALAAHQVAMNVFNLLAFALDALAIAAQALIGHGLGAGAAAEARRATTLMTRWGGYAGVGLGLITAALAWVLPLLFTPDPGVRRALTTALLVLALTQPIAGIVFVLDGVLMGAGDSVMLAWLQVAALAAYLPVLLVVRAAGGGLGAAAALAVVWAALAWFMMARLLGLVWRARTDRWLVTGG
ncbi:MATE family efflux transporter [Metallococcus carri]|uniref:MATE family efflux transporter n=1 Tax=Metallococcus carri TaxID=1656884 RepID=UPI002E2DAA2E|nr:MATE family efflux transporter [Metallococcus carri]